MEGLKDIKGLIKIEDYTLYISIFITLFLVLLLWYILKKVMHYKRVVSPIKRAKKELKNLNLEKSKETSYKICKYATVLSDENFDYLEKYKYKKEVEGFSKEDLKKIERFLDGI